LNRFAAALLVVSGACIASCASVIGFPDRALDDAVEAGTSEGGDLPDASNDQASPDTSMPVDAGPARAVLSTASVDFGLVSCGAAVPAAKVVTITNAGGAPLDWTAALATTPDFAISGASAGTIAPGAFGTLTIESTAVPALSGAGDTAQAMLTITTNDLQNTTTALPVKRTAAGGTLSIVPLTADFGETPAGVAAQDIPLAFKNTGNQSVIVGLGAVTPAAGFSLTWTGAPAAVSLAPGATLPLLVGHFSPPALTYGTFTSTSPLTVTGALCGTNPTSITLTGTSTTSAASVGPGSLDFGLVDCGTTAAPKKVKISNSSATAFTWSAALMSAAGYYTLSPTSGTVAGNSFVEVTVSPVAVPGTSAISPNLYGDTLTITTTAPGDSPHVVDLLETAHGAILAQSTGAIDFGSVLASSPATSTFKVSNSGNAAATVSFDATPSVFTLSPQAQVVGAGAAYDATVRFAPTAQQSYAGTATMKTTGTVLCAPLPKPAITLTGNGALSAQVTPTTVDFGLVSCGSTAAAKTVTLTNTSQATFSWTAAIATAYYTITPTSGTLAKTKSVDITITPKAIPTVSDTKADLYADTLKITTSPGLESPYVASLHMTAEGAILSFNPTTLAFGSQKKDTSRTKSYAVVNTGNFAAPITLTKTGSSFSISPTSSTANAGSSASLNATFSPTSTSSSSGTVTVTTTAKRCAPLPAAMTMTGTGT
jgi:hypothetical protein